MIEIAPYGPLRLHRLCRPRAVHRQRTQLLFPLTLSRMIRDRIPSAPAATGLPANSQLPIRLLIKKARSRIHTRKPGLTEATSTVWLYPNWPGTLSFSVRQTQLDLSIHTNCAPIQGPHLFTISMALGGPAIASPRCWGICIFQLSFLATILDRYQVTLHARGRHLLRLLCIERAILKCETERRQKHDLSSNVDPYLSMPSATRFLLFTSCHSRWHHTTRHCQCQTRSFQTMTALQL
jgi:hypothetical protein